jgi:hypothetical protein
VQRTRPDTLAVALNDSPAGLAAWIVDKWRDWSDCGGDLDSRFTKDELLTTITLVLAQRHHRHVVRRILGLATAGRPEAWHDRADVPPGVDSKPLPAGQQVLPPAAVALFDHVAP